MRFLLVALTLGALAAPAAAAVRTATVKYEADVPLVGHVYWDDAAKGKRPGVLVVHEWWGLNEHSRAKAQALAEAGYVAFALDMYGEGKSTMHPQEAGQWAGAVRQNAAAGKARFDAALAQLRKNAGVDGRRIAAIGYCFGGAVVLTMAGAGADLDAVVSFHGALPTDSIPPGTVKAKVLVAHGAEDEFVTPQTVHEFMQVMERARADWQLTVYSGAKHGFTNPDAAKAGMAQLAYDPKADRRSWQAMLALFDEVFGKQ